MSVDNHQVIDAVSISAEGNVSLLISDHLEWDDDNYHLLILQDKINAYLGAIESGELCEKYPLARGRNVEILIYFLYEPGECAKKFLEIAKKILNDAGYGLEIRLTPHQ